MTDFAAISRREYVGAESAATNNDKFKSARESGHQKARKLSPHCCNVAHRRVACWSKLICACFIVRYLIPSLSRL